MPDVDINSFGEILGGAIQSFGIMGVRCILVCNMVKVGPIKANESKWWGPRSY